MDVKFGYDSWNKGVFYTSFHRRDVASESAHGSSSQPSDRMCQSVLLTSKLLHSWNILTPQT